MKQSSLLAKFTALHIWGETTGFEIEAVCAGMEDMSTLLRTRRFDLIIVENDLARADDYAQLKNIKDKGYCRHIALCSAQADFDAARSGIRIGVDDYFTLPLDEETVTDLFDRIKAESSQAQESAENLAVRLKELVYKGDDALGDFLDHLYSMNVMQQVVRRAAGMIFEENEWMDLYVNEAVFSCEEPMNAFLVRRMFLDFAGRYRMLLPDHNESLKEVIEYIVYNPESDLRQKTISEDLHINKSYLSTVFVSQTGVRFVDYTTHVKLLRAAWLLKNTDMKISEISLRMDYKDTAYFSRNFKDFFKMRPSEYRLPDEYDFQI